MRLELVAPCLLVRLSTKQLIIVTLFLAAMIYVAVADDSADTHITARVGKPLYIKEYTDPDGTVHFTQLEG
uniref:Uncharacterized protein n=1 Tax=Nephila pilipes TaxID=299642 RepID=A0A8X6PT81_NEPPI|nr:hypothetical protein NPIL_492411 [Nephila pilipes]GFT82934.1 hypothetical protein NPIL_3401 [Nephila pilipes]